MKWLYRSICLLVAFIGGVTAFIALTAADGDLKIRMSVGTFGAFWFMTGLAGTINPQVVKELMFLLWP